jgi:hypothetical protein
MPCSDKYDKELTFLRAPDVLDDAHEINTRDWSDWRKVGEAYGSVATQGTFAAGRQLEVARQAHGIVDAIITTEWTETAQTIDNGCAIRLSQFGIVTYWHVVAAVNVNMDYTQMMFICRNTKPGGVE